LLLCLADHHRSAHHRITHHHTRTAHHTINHNRGLCRGAYQPIPSSLLWRFVQAHPPGVRVALARFLSPAAAFFSHPISLVIPVHEKVHEKIFFDFPVHEKIIFFLFQSSFVLLISFRFIDS
jgi:hypothetical protein